MQAPFTEPRPKREDIPDNINAADVLHEVRLNRWEDRKWRYEVNGDLGFLRRFRAAVNDSVRATIIIVPVGGLLLGILAALRII